MLGGQKWLEAMELGRRCEISFRWLNYFADRFLVNVTVSRGKDKERKKNKKRKIYARYQASCVFCKI